MMQNRFAKRALVALLSATMFFSSIGSDFAMASESAGEAVTAAEETAQPDEEEKDLPAQEAEDTVAAEEDTADLTEDTSETDPPQAKTRTDHHPERDPRWCRIPCGRGTGRQRRLSDVSHSGTRNRSGR